MIKTKQLKRQHNRIKARIKNGQAKEGDEQKLKELKLILGYTQ